MCATGNNTGFLAAWSARAGFSPASCPGENSKMAYKVTTVVTGVRGCSLILCNALRQNEVMICW